MSPNATDLGFLPRHAAPGEECGHDGPEAEDGVLIGNEAGAYHRRVGLNTLESAGGQSSVPWHARTRPLRDPRRAVLGQPLHRLLAVGCDLAVVADHGLSDAWYMQAHG